MESISPKSITTRRISMASRSFGIRCKVRGALLSLSPAALLDDDIAVLDVLKMGGPYAGLTFLNASVVSEIEREHFRRCGCVVLELL
jgi:hypothetical protein